MNTVDQRQRYILQKIDETGSVSVIELADAFDVSEMTIRRDLNDLEKAGIVRRTHGGAVSARGRGYEPPLALRSTENRAIKQLLGKYASEMVIEGDSIAMDVGSTIYEIASNLGDTNNITVVTPSIPIASLFYDRPNIRLILPGGIIRPGEQSMIGDLAKRNLEILYVDRLFLGVGALDANIGLTEYNMDDTAIKQAMIKNAKEVILVADASKFQKIAFAFVAPFSAIHHLVTNEEPPAALMNSLRNSDVLVHIVNENGTKVLSH